MFTCMPQNRKQNLLALCEATKIRTEREGEKKKEEKKRKEDEKGKEYFANVSPDVGTIVKNNVGETSQRRGGAHMGVSEHIDTILN